MTIKRKSLRFSRNRNLPNAVSSIESIEGIRVQSLHNLLQQHDSVVCRTLTVRNSKMSHSSK